MLAFLFFFIWMLFGSGCATTRVQPEIGPCKPGEIYFGIDGKAWKPLAGGSHKARPIYVYECLENDEGNALNLEAFYDGYRYQLYGKTYGHIMGFSSFGEMKAHIDMQRKMLGERPKVKEQGK